MGLCRLLWRILHSLTEVRLRARVSFDLPSSHSPVDPASVKGMKEDGYSVVSIPQLWTGLSLTLLLSFVPTIRISTSCSALQVRSFSSGSTPWGQSRSRLHLSPTASLASCSGPSSCWGGEGGLCCVRVTLQGPYTLRFSMLAGCDLFSSIILSFALCTVLSRTAVQQHRAGALLVSIFGTTSVSPLSSDWLVLSFWETSCYMRLC